MPRSTSVRENLNRRFFCEGEFLEDMERINFKNERLMSLLMVLFGNIIYVMAVKFFVLPANLISCGTTGIALVVNQLLKIPMTVFILVFNVVMLCIGWWNFGKQFAMSTIFSSLFYPVMLEILNRTLGDVVITENQLLNVLFAGMGLGFSLGLVIRGGASTGGMDIPPLMLKKYFRIPVSASLWVFDFCIMMTQAAYHPLEDLLYGVLLLITISVTLNKIMLLGTSKTEVKIVSNKALQIRDGILSQVDRGCTLLHGEGGYLHNQTEVILSIVSNHELPKIERLAREIDPACFMIINRVTEVWGRGFSYGKAHAAPKDKK